MCRCFFSCFPREQQSGTEFKCDKRVVHTRAFTLTKCFKSSFICSNFSRCVWKGCFCSVLAQAAVTADVRASLSRRHVTHCAANFCRLCDKFNHEKMIFESKNRYLRKLNKQAICQKLVLYQLRYFGILKQNLCWQTMFTFIITHFIIFKLGVRY